MLDYDQIMPLVKRVAASVSRNFPSYVEPQDTEGQLLLWVYQRKAMIGQAMEDGPDWESKIVPLMRKVAFDHCNAEKAAAEGYDPSDIYRYSIQKIRSLLADALNYEDWQSFGMHGENLGGSKPHPLTYGDRVAELVDVKMAAEALNEETYALLVSQYRHHLTTAELAERFDIAEETVRKRSQRAFKALQKELGYKSSGESPQAPQKRSVRTNAASRAALSNQYEGA